MSLLPERKSQPRGISLEQKENIIKLLGGVNPVKKRFWLNIATAEEAVPDLISHIE